MACTSIIITLATLYLKAKKQIDYGHVLTLKGLQYLLLIDGMFNILILHDLQNNGCHQFYVNSTATVQSSCAELEPLCQNNQPYLQVRECEAIAWQ